METSPTTVFSVKRQLPTEHLQVLRCPNDPNQNTSHYLSPGLHNTSDTWIRYLRAKAYEFIDELGQRKNQHKLMCKNVTERKGINQWCDNIKWNAGIFTLGIHDEHVAARQQEFMANMIPDESQWKFLDEDPFTNQLEVPFDRDEVLYLLFGASDSITSVISEYESVFDSDETSVTDEYMESDASDESLLQSDEEGPGKAFEATLALNYCGLVDYRASLLDTAIASLSRESDPLSSNSATIDEKSFDIAYRPYPTLPTTTYGVNLKAEKELARQERMIIAEGRLASAWYNYGGYNDEEARLTQCSWLPIPSQETPASIKTLAQQSPIPLIQVTGPEGAVSHLMERQPILPKDFDLYVAERKSAQAGMKKRVKRSRDYYETYTEYCSRLTAEEWWADREAEAAKEMAEQDENVRKRRCIEEDREYWA